jgi:predicted DNA-binding ribbon-helix-helix protein
MSRTLRHALNAVGKTEGGLRVHSLYLDRHRTSIRLDAQAWEALCDIAERENLTVHEICQKVAACERLDGLSFTAALRSFITSYFRAAAADTLPERHQ